MDNPETLATLDIRHRTKTNKTTKHITTQKTTVSHKFYIKQNDIMDWRFFLLYLMLTNY